MNSADQFYTEKVLSILHSNDNEAIKQLEQTIEMLHTYLQSNNGHGQDIPDKVISFKNVVRLNNHPDPRLLPGG
jgi:capsule polysaccharide export protein KpsC/LpsZ